MDVLSLPVSIWQSAASLQAQTDRAQAKLEDLRAAKGSDAVEAALEEQRRMETATNEALRAGPAIDADKKAPVAISINNGSSSKGSSSPTGASSSNLSPKASAAPRNNLDLPDSSSPSRAQSKMDDTLNDNEQNDNTVIVKKSGFSAAKPLLSTKVALPHHLAPMQVRL